MDSTVIEYLRSGKAWLFVGSGPSIEMRYPSWEELAIHAVEVATIEQRGVDLRSLNTAMQRKDYPKVFQEAENILGAPRLLQCLLGRNARLRNGTIYELIARWPIDVYLTTNYDDELQNALASLGLSYLTYSNSEDHLGLLVPGLSGAIFKLHGDLRSENGLVLTSHQYREIIEGDSWEYWRTKLTSVFQMNPIIVIGHSLSDRNIKHVLEAARKGASVTQPVCWLAPDVPDRDRREFLETYRIRVVSYDNRDGEHRNLARLINSLSEFIPSRPVVRIQDQIDRISHPALGADAAAPGFFVFNTFSAKDNFEDKRINIVVSAIQSTLPELPNLGEFTLEEALKTAGWPEDTALETEFGEQVRLASIQQNLLVPKGRNLRVNDEGLALSHKNRQSFYHMRDRFKNSLLLRIKRQYPALTDKQASTISSDIESSLSGYFKEGGLSLASTLFSRDRRPTVPSSIVPFITMASARYDDLLMRQAFSAASVDVFVHPESADRDYLGRISQGFFAFHALGVFGKVAIERLRHAKETVWLVDSDAQIRALAVAATANTAYRRCFSRLREGGLRFFTTESLFDETRQHLSFADRVIRENGTDSPYIVAASRGDVPYRKSNDFLEGFVRWRDAGNPSDWQGYLYQVYGQRGYSEEAIRKALGAIGIEVIALSDWPGFLDAHYNDVEVYANEIAKIWEGTQQQWVVPDLDQPVDPHKKAKPEAEALNIVVKERQGLYYVNSEDGYESDSWFVSNTSILNLVEKQSRITWQPEAFQAFASTLCDISTNESADHAFDMLLVAIAQSGLNVLDDDTIARVFGTAIDQAKLSMEQLRTAYHDTIEEKYGEPLESVMARVTPGYGSLAVIQLANEVAETAAKRKEVAAKSEREAVKRAEVAEKKLEQVEKFRRKMEEKQARQRARRRRPRKNGRKKKRK